MTIARNMTVPALILAVTIIFLFYFNEKRNFTHPLLTMQPDHLTVFENNNFDNIVTRVTSHHFAEEGFLKHYLLPNRKGHPGMSLWGVPCFGQSEKPSLTIENSAGEQRLITSFENDCIYTREPFAADLLWGIFRKWGATDNNFAQIAFFLHIAGLIILTFFFANYFGMLSAIIGVSVFSASPFFLQSLNQTYYHPFIAITIPLMLWSADLYVLKGRKLFLYFYLVIHLFVNYLSLEYFFYGFIWIIFLLFFHKEERRRIQKILWLTMSGMILYVCLRLLQNYLFLNDIKLVLDDFINVHARYNSSFLVSEFKADLIFILNFIDIRLGPWWLTIPAVFYIYLKNSAKSLRQLSAWTIASISFIIFFPTYMMKHPLHIGFHLMLPYALMTTQIVHQLVGIQMSAAGIKKIISFPMVFVLAVGFKAINHLILEGKWLRKYESEISLIMTNVKIRDFYLTPISSNNPSARHAFTYSYKLVDGLISESFFAENVFDIDANTSFEFSVFFEDVVVINSINIIAEIEIEKIECDFSVPNGKLKYSEFNRNKASLIRLKNSDYIRTQIFNDTVTTRSLQGRCRSPHAIAMREIEFISKH